MPQQGPRHTPRSNPAIFFCGNAVRLTPPCNLAAFSRGSFARYSVRYDSAAMSITARNSVRYGPAAMSITAPPPFPAAEKLDNFRCRSYTVNDK
ncbi:MAG: hypothetical protein BHW56_07390 [Acetobacter sp. 46_36]|nr:MAG: hypothetical protein BHW56_07390 [Acetobacter sp. 46_36]